MRTMHEESFIDGSGWDAVVEVRGFNVCATFIEGKLKAFTPPARFSSPRVPAWALRQVEKWAAARVEALGPEWMAKHRALYGV